MATSSHLKYALLATAFAMAATSALARDQIRAVGSSTVYPFVTVAAEQFGKQGKFKTPIVESIGTGGGFKMFCASAGEDSPDMSNASRPITDSEKDMCTKSGVGTITELPIGYDGIVIAANKKAAPLGLTRTHLFLGLGKQIPKEGKLVNNPYITWNEVDPNLPKQPIMVYGPPPTSGTRDAFVELAFEDACKNLPEFKAAYADEKERSKACKLVREDGKYIESGEDDNLIVRKLGLSNDALGIVGYSYMEENASTLQGMRVDGVEPTFENIAGGKYKLSRTMYVYVKNAHIGKVEGLGEFARELTSEVAMSQDGYMAAKGLIPLTDAERNIARARAAALK